MSEDEIRLEFSALYKRLSRRSQEMFLIKLSSWLTVMARDTYIVGENGVRDPERLRAFNEAQHRILGQLNGLASDRKERYPDDVFVDILLEWFQALSLAPRNMIAIVENRHPHIT